jgi:hypothetical protein
MTKKAKNEMKAIQRLPTEMGEIGNVGNFNLEDYHISFCSWYINIGKYICFFENVTIQGQEC